MEYRAMMEWLQLLRNEDFISYDQFKRATEILHVANIGDNPKNLIDDIVRENYKPEEFESLQKLYSYIVENFSKGNIIFSYKEIMEKNRLIRKNVLVTDGMSDDKFVFRTNAPEEEIEKWLYQYNEGLENNQNVFLDPLKEKYMVELLFDSEMNFRDEFDDLEEEGFDYTYDLGDYREFWEKITSKSVEDSDGLMTDYTMYKKRATGEYAFVFGDSELYTPDNSSFDYECATESQAWEWFNSYTGFKNSDEKERDFLKKIEKLEDELSETDDPYRREDIHELIEELLEAHSENLLSDAERTIIEFRAKTEELYHKIDDAEYRDIEEAILEELQRLSTQNDWGVVFKDVVMTGSRARGLEKSNSDLDFVAEYECETEYNIKEYVVYNYIKEVLKEPYGGTDIKIDINPIRAEETGTLADYLPKAEEYLQGLKALHLAEEVTLFIYDNDISEYLSEICKGETITLQNAVYRVRDDIIKNNVAHYIEYFRQAAKEFSFNDELLPTCINLEDKLKEYSPNRLLVDMDGTLAVFRSVDCLETLYEEGYFLNLEPNTNVVDAIKIIIREHPEMDVFIMSSVLSDSKYALAEKNAWLDKYLPEIDAEHRIFPPCGENKLEYVPDGVRTTDCLLDDYTHNLTLWEPPAKGIKLLNGINHTSGTWKGNMIRYDKTANMIAENIVEIVSGNKMVIEKRPQDDEQRLENVSDSKLPDDISDDIAKLSKQAEELDTKLNEIQDLISFLGSRYNISLNTTKEPSEVDKNQEESFIPLQPKHKDIKL